MEDLVILNKSENRLNLRGRRILVTGHTGFKGAWLCEWLLFLGAEVHGISLPPEESSSLFEVLGLKHSLKSHIETDIRDSPCLNDAINKIEPEIVFHLAAQSLVRRSYREPKLTWETNVLGSLNVLEALRLLRRPVTVIIVTTDKVYRNREWEFAYREDDELGGHDPYSASKAACEIAVASWRSSFGNNCGVTVFTARAGNVIGPGDQNEDRIVPDCFRAWNSGSPIELRYPNSTRPWQHVLEPLSGYLLLATKNLKEVTPALNTCNFGPGTNSLQTVRNLVSCLAGNRPERSWIELIDKTDFHETKNLALCTDRARLILNWTPRLTFDETVNWTAEGYNSPASELSKIVRRQIIDFEKITTSNK